MSLIQKKICSENVKNKLNFGEQPIAKIMESHSLKAQDMVASSTEQLTFKMVTRACKGRRLTTNVQSKICNALNKATGKKYSIEELFVYKHSSDS